MKYYWLFQLISPEKNITIFNHYLRRRRRLCFRCGLFVCLSVCLSAGLLANLWTDFDEIFWRGRAWLKDQVIQFWWRSGSRFRSGSPKSEIRILQIGGGLWSLSISSFYCINEHMEQLQHQAMLLGVSCRRTEILKKHKSNGCRFLNEPAANTVTTV